jgi:hypothetical protein
LSLTNLRSFQLMNENNVQKLLDRAVVVALTHDEARMWLLNDDSSNPVVRIKREEPEHVHVRQAQAHHGHASEIGESAYFAEIADALMNVSSIVLMGHGSGKANAATRFVHHVASHFKALSLKITVTGTINIPALGESEIIREARRQWKATVEMS